MTRSLGDLVSKTVGVTHEPEIKVISNLQPNVNLGNIAPNEVIPLETLRVGLRGDTFFQFLPEEFQNLRIKPETK